MSLGDVIKSSIINMLFFWMFVTIFMSTSIFIFENFISKNIFLFVAYIPLLKNIVFSSPGNKLLGIKVQNEKIKDCLALLLCNLYYVLPFLLVYIPQEIRTEVMNSQAFRIVFTCFFIFYSINLFYRYFISHNINLVERILGVSMYKQVKE